ncbi:MAG: lytic transglycosylase F [Bacteroidetes bacterium]|nr:MAG: lytic transglycosylase F [Bacteroidota bacterium]
MNLFKRNISLQIFLILILFFSACNSNNNQEPKQKKIKVRDYSEIKQLKKLRVVTNLNSTDYFIYRGQPMGFQLELMQFFAKELNVDLEIIAQNNLTRCFNMLENDSCDIIAIGLTITKNRNEKFNFTVPYGLTNQVLVQRKPDNWPELSRKKIESKLIRNQLDLAKKTIYVQQNSAFVTRLKSLSQEIGDTIYIKQKNIETEELIKKVAKKEINYTICDEYIGLVNKTYYPQLDVATKISFPQKLAWAVNKQSDTLLNILNNWLTDFKKTRKFKAIYNKYFKNPKSVNIFNSDYYLQETGQISPYDNYFKKYAKELHWDWKLIASLAYQESHFNNNARSWAGAFGIMQLMPITAERFNVDTNSSPAENIRAGIKYLKYLDKQLSDEITDTTERKKFIIASYNSGLGHVLDARRLAEKFDKNPNIWINNVDFYMAKKSNSKFYLDPVVRYGYCRGSETVNYVTEIFSRYDHYKNIYANKN